MKKVLFIISALIMGFSCSTGAEDPVSQDSGSLEITSREMTPPEFWRIFFDYTSTFTEQNVPGNMDGEAEHKKIFATAFSYWLTEGHFGDADVYSPVYQLWRLQYDLNASTRSVADEADAVDLQSVRQNVRDRLVSLIQNEVTTRAVGAEEYLKIGLDLQHIYDLCKKEVGTGFLTIRESLRRMLVWEITEEYFGRTLDSGIMYDEMDRIYDLLSDALFYRDSSFPNRPYEGCFTFHDGVYLTRQFPASEMAITVLGECLPVLAGSPDLYTRRNFLTGLVELFERNGNDMYAVAGGRTAMEKIFRSIATAAYMDAESQTVDYYFDLEQDDFIFPGMGPDEDRTSTWVNYSTNSSWSILSSTEGVEVYTKGGGTDGVETTEYIDFYPYRNTGNENRYENITIGYGNGQTKNINITVEPDKAWSTYFRVTPNPVNFSRNNWTAEVDVDTDGPWRLSSDTHVSDVTPSSGYGRTKVLITVSPEYGPETREDMVFFEYTTREGTALYDVVCYVNGYY